MNLRPALTALPLVALLACAPAPAPQAAPAPQSAALPGVQGWSHRHPEASAELGEWVKKYNEAAALFFQWDGEHPQAFKEFVTWVVLNPNQPITTFVRAHMDWPEFSAQNEEHRWAGEAFMEWCRKHPKAAEDLVSQSGNLKWTGEHLYKGMWKVEE